MRDRIVQTAARHAMPILSAFALFLLFRGHNAPGGGFVAGLVAGGAVAFYTLAYDVPRARALVRVPPRTLIGVGLVVAVATAAAPTLLGLAPLTSGFVDLPVPLVGEVALGSTLAFDAGVLLTVLGTTTAVVFSLGGR